MTSQVKKKKERTAKNEEIRRIRTTGNGVLPDEVIFFLNCRNLIHIAGFQVSLEYQEI